MAMNMLRQLLFVLVPIGLIPLPQAADAPGIVSSEISESQARVARRIVRALEAGRFEEARVDAMAGVKQHPSNFLLRRRLGQVFLCLAMQFDNQFAHVIEDTAYAQILPLAVDILRNGPPSGPGDVEDPEKSEQARQDWKAAGAKLLTPELMTAVTHFREQVRRQLEQSEALLERDSQVLLHASAELKEARRLGDNSVELALSELWAQVLVLLWREEARSLAGSSSGNKVVAGATATPPELPVKQLAELIAKQRASQEKILAAFDSTTSQSVLHNAAALVKRHPADAAALAGAADLITVVASLRKTRDPLRSHILALLNHRYLKDRAAFNPEATAAARKAARQLYLQARDAKDPDAVTAPTTVALQLYEKALQHDPEWSLPSLRLRLYLIRLAFDPEAAESLLTEIGRHDPQNAVVALERARAAFLLDGKPADGLAACREAARLRGFSRSYLVAVPTLLRPALKLQRGLRGAVEEGWPGYEWLFITLQDVQRAQREAAAQMEIRLLRLKLTDRLCQAPDYADQALGIHQKSLVLSQLSGMVDRVPPEQRALLLVQQAEHRRAFSDFPVTRQAMVLDSSGPWYYGYPHLNTTPIGKMGVTVMMRPPSGMVLLSK